MHSCMTSPDNPALDSVIFRGPLQCLPFCDSAVLCFFNNHEFASCEFMNWGDLPTEGLFCCRMLCRNWAVIIGNVFQVLQCVTSQYKRVETYWRQSAHETSSEENYWETLYSSKLYLLLERNQYCKIPLDFQEEGYQQCCKVNCLEGSNFRKGNLTALARSFLLQLLPNTKGWSLLLQVKAVGLMSKYILISKTGAMFCIKKKIPWSLVLCSQIDWCLTEQLMLCGKVYSVWSVLMIRSLSLGVFMRKLQLLAIKEWRLENRSNWKNSNKIHYAQYRIL